MPELLNRFFRSRRNAPLPSVPPGQRIYAVGDVHGRMDLFSALVTAIEKDDRSRDKLDSTVIMLGDLVDRGPSSARVISSARAWAKARNVRFLSGNHEELFLLSFYKISALKSFLKFGGRETLQSYGLDLDEIDAMSASEVQKLISDEIPREDREFLRNFETMVRIGDYLFVHAGIRPKVSLSEQAGHDCRWIRDPFLNYEGDHGIFVVHGHTVTDDFEMRGNRIGIDTGAYMSGRLTALVLEGTDRHAIQTREVDGKIVTTTRNLFEEPELQAVPGSL